jgi:hypothetical protein
VTGAVYLNIEGGVPQAGAGIELARVYLGIGGLDLEGGFFGSATVRRIGLEPIKRAYGVFVDDQTFVIPERGLDFALTVRIRKKGPLGTNESTIFRRARLTNVNPVVGFVDSFTGAFQLNLSVGEGSEHLDLVFNGTLGGELVDSDDDGIIDAVDNCPFVSNPDQSDEPPEFVDVPDLVYTKCTLDEPTSLVLPTVSDACTPENVSLEAVITSVNGEPLAPVLFVENNIGALPTGTLEIEWTAIDANGNATMTTQAVEVIAEPVLFANGELKIGDGVSVLDQQARGATLVNTGTTETNLGVSALSGDVLSAPTLVLRNNALVEGFAKTGATIEPQDGADVLGAKLEHAEFSLPEFFDPAPSFPPSGLDYDLQPGEEIPLAPGSYGRISVKSGAVLSLASDSVSGRYFFDELVAIEPGATVVLDQSEGPIDIYVSNKLFYRGVFVDTNDDYSTFTIGYYGTETAFFEQSFNGVITAPNAKLVLGGADGHTGRFFGQDIEVYPHQGITYAPYGCTPSVSMVAASCGDGLLNGMETDLDCGGPDCAGCPEGAVCSGSSDCLGGNCTGGVCQSGSSPSCSEETALDIGGPGNDMTVPNDSCLMVRDAYPSWWGVRNLQLQTTSGGDYPAPFTWSNPCVNGGSGASGSAALSFDWQSIVFGPTSSECATIISLNGDGTGEVTVRYWAN